jgi:hypothetical protein
LEETKIHQRLSCQEEEKQEENDVEERVEKEEKQEEKNHTCLMQSVIDLSTCLPSSVAT